MPTLEFHGYDANATQRLEAYAREKLGDLDYREDIVFVRGPATQVIAWNGEPKPFIRVLTRKPQRAEEIRARLLDETDVETVLIDFHPRRART